MKKLFLTLCALALLSVSAYAGPTYFTSLSGTVETGATNTIETASATYTFGLQVPLRGDRSILLGYRTINLAGPESNPQSFNLGVVDYYSMGGSWKMGVWLAGDYELTNLDDGDRMNALLGFSVEKSITALFAGELYNTWTVKDGRDFVTFGLNFKVTPPTGG